jgi:hypothetical protein
MSAVTRAVELAVGASLPVALRGRPGVGKTSIVEAIAAATGMDLEVVVGSLREPTDLVGLPIVRADGGIDLAVPRWALNANAATSGAIVLFDELTTASPAVQAAMLRVVRERVVGDLHLADHVRIVAAYNDAVDCGGYDLELPMRSRFVHLSVVSDVAVFCDGLLNGWRSPVITPPGAQRELTNWRAVVAAFIRARPSLLEAAPEIGSSGGYPTPRSWELAALAAEAVERFAEDSEVRSLLIAGCVGPGAAAEFCSFLDNLDLPDPRSILAEPHSIREHLDQRRPDRVMLVLHGVVDTVVRSQDPEMWVTSWEIAEIAATSGFADLAAWAFRPIAMARPQGAPIPQGLHAVRQFLERVA